MNSADDPKQSDIIHRLHPSLRDSFLPFPLSKEDLAKVCPPEKQKQIAREIIQMVNESRKKKGGDA